MKNKTLEAFQTWVLVITAEVKRTCHERGMDVTADRLEESTRELYDAIQNEEITDGGGK
jgi:hypothetical protein